jgi:hypothetical protein
MVKLVRICFIGVNCKPILSKKKIFLDSRPKVKFDRRINELSKQILTDFTTQHLVEGAFYLPRSGFVQQLVSPERRGQGDFEGFYFK